MLDHHRQELARARALRARGSAIPLDGMPPPDILDSWARCLDAGMDCASELVVPVVEAGELAWRRERHAVVRRLAQAELETLARQIAGSNFLLAFADPEGVILDHFADHRFAMNNDGAPIVAGSAWGESLAGTNGLGTALASGHSVAVTGPEHYFLSLGDISCTATPVIDAHGHVAGVLDASSYVEARQRHTQALVQMAATHIENGLFVHQMRQHLVLAIHPRPEYLGTLSAGRLAFDGEGRLTASCARARQLLAGLEARPGARFESLFGEPFEALLARIGRAEGLRLRDTMGSALTAHCLNPLPDRTPAPAAVPAPRRLADARAAAPRQEAGPVLLDATVQQAYATGERALALGVPILIRGETGTGKELLARHLHRVSRRHGAFVAINCAALPADLVEAELFGYAGGAFTGAKRDGSAGLIASADGGTLLLDELRELPLPVQAKLLRFLDDAQVRSVGSAAARRVDVLLLAATHGELEDDVAAGRFRADLMYRLNTVTVRLPALRERSDFAPLVRHLLTAIDPRAEIDDGAIHGLARQAWPGNFRELRGVLTRALLASGRRLDVAALAGLLPGPETPAGAAVSALQTSASELVRRAYERNHHSVSETARELGISRTTVYRHLRGRH